MPNYVYVIYDERAHPDAGTTDGATVLGMSNRLIQARYEQKELGYSSVLYRYSRVNDELVDELWMPNEERG